MGWVITNRDENKDWCKANPLGLRDQWGAGLQRPPRVGARIVVIFIFCSILVLSIEQPVLAIRIVSGLLCIFVLTLASLRILACTLAFIPEKPHKTIPENWRNTPRFTILVPLLHEAHMVPGLVNNLLKLNYPKNKLDIVLVTEACDLTTIRAARVHARGPIRVFITPQSEPRTKPKALNAALAAIPSDKRGEIITVYDAEDKPHPNQLKTALNALRNDRCLLAVQAPLGYYNGRKNGLTRQFDIEYGALFRIWNPALCRLGLPFPLGGTSNHIKKWALEDAGGWDAQNVTEDADLSFRLFALDLSNNCRRPNTPRIGVIPNGTKEEAVSSLQGWIKQRSRWQKGFMQTVCVHLRRHKSSPNSNTPINWRQNVKIRLSLLFTLGASLILGFVHIPSLMFLLAVFGFNVLPAELLPNKTFVALTVGVGYISSILMGICGVIKARKSYAFYQYIFMPLYWCIAFVPTLLALYQFWRAPSYWEKTTHSAPSENQPKKITDPSLAAQ